jgi:hypothetical protein
MLKAIPRDYFDPAKGTLKLLWEDEWRGLGITQVGPVAQNSQGGPLADLMLEPGLGTLRSTRTGTTYSTLQVSLRVGQHPHRLLMIAQQASDQLSTTTTIMRKIRHEK